MRLKALTAALIGLSVLCLAGCASSRKATSSSSERRVQSLESVEIVDSVIVEQRDTLREVTTITIDRNDKGDTLKVVQVTDRSSIRDRDRFKVQDSRLMIKTDTVYIEKRDSVFVQNTGLTNDTKKKSGFLTYVKWIFALICAVVVLIITVKVCLLRR